MNIDEAKKIIDVHNNCDLYVTCELCPIDIRTDKINNCGDVVISAYKLLVECYQQRIEIDDMR